MITTEDAYVAAVTQRQQRLWFNRVTSSGASASGEGMVLRGTGFPTMVTTTPSGLQFYDNTSTGGLPFTNSSNGLTTYLSRVAIRGDSSSTKGTPCELIICDRLVNYGGYSTGTSSFQSYGIDLLGNLSNYNLVERIGSPDFSQVSWYIEDFGGTATSATAVWQVTYTNHKGVSGQTVTVTVPYPMGGNSHIQIVPNTGDNIRSIEGMTYVSGGTAGTWSICAYRDILPLAIGAVYQMYVFDYESTGMPIIPNSTCLFMNTRVDPTCTAQSDWYGSLSLVQG